MFRPLLTFFLLFPVVLLAQDTTTCSQLTIDLDGDLQIGAGDILMLLGGYGTNLDLDGDMIPDCQDDCVGVYDECGVCNGPGPQVQVLDTIIITYDSIYVEAINDWVTYELGADSVFTLECEDPGNFNACGDPIAMDGYSYSTILIGTNAGLRENLRTTVYENGDAIPASLTDGEWGSTTSGATAVYGEDDGCDNFGPDIDACDEAQSLSEYGRLYNWYAVDDARACVRADGMSQPMESGRFGDLHHFTRLQRNGGNALKSTYGWNDGGNGTDDFGFSALPGGCRTQQMATSTMPGTAATGGVLRPVAAMLGTGT